MLLAFRLKKARSPAEAEERAKSCGELLLLSISFF